MIELAVSVEDEISKTLQAFADPRTQSRLTNYVLARIGRRYRAHLRANYLGGQMINGGSGTGSLSGRMRVYKDKRQKNTYIVGEKMTDQGDGRRVKLANIYEHAGGYVIIPKKKKSLLFVDAVGFWIHTKKIVGRARPFMSESVKSFDWTGITRSEASSVYDKELEKAAGK